jgi:hypothetical protein
VVDVADDRDMTVGLFKETLMGSPGRVRSADEAEVSREVRLRRLRELVARGQYTVDHDAVATAIVRRATFTNALSAKLAAEARRS